MNRIEIRRRVVEHLKTHHIQYMDDFNSPCGHERLLLNFVNRDNAPGETIEATFILHNEWIESQAYYNQVGSILCKRSDHIPELYRVLNYINARVLLTYGDTSGNGLYSPTILYTPRINLSEGQSFNIQITTIVNNDFFTLTPVETLDYLTEFQPEFLNILAPPIFGLLDGILTPEMAIRQIKHDCID